MIMKLNDLNHCLWYYWLRLLLFTSIFLNVSPENTSANTTITTCHNSLPQWSPLCPPWPSSSPIPARTYHHNNGNRTFMANGSTSAATSPASNVTTTDDGHKKKTMKYAAAEDVRLAASLSLESVASSTIRRHTREADEQIDKCRLFEEGEPTKNELYSPDYPNNYPKNINCTRVITAPKGQIIRLDFRNSFHIEDKEECKFDFLEIRDGQYGFSNLIGKFCGTDFPPEITSKERYLWLHFHSDESIEYSGFTAVYEFIDRNREAPSTDLNCTIEKDGYEGFINSTDVPQDIREVVIRNKIPLDCMWRIQVQDKWKIQVKFLDFKLSKPNDCETNFLDIFPEQTVIPRRVKNFCGSAGEGLTSETNILHMRFYAEQIAINSSFAILYTAFRDRGNTGCTEEEYDCEDATCISKELFCNGRDNCKFRWDEESCKTDTGRQSEHIIIIMIVFGLILGGMVITFLVNCIRKIVRDQKIIREHIRQSKESKLDEMGRNSKARSRENLHAVIQPNKSKQSQISLANLNEVASRYYREPPDLKYKEHSILRQQNDIYVQTSLCGGGGGGASADENASSSTTTNTPDPRGFPHSAEMACQTRESLFATAPVQAPPKSSYCDSEDRMSQFVRQQKFQSPPTATEACHLHQKHHHQHQTHQPKHQHSSQPTAQQQTHHHPPQTPQPANVYHCAVTVPQSQPLSTTATAERQRQGADGPKPKAKKLDQSKILIDVRNSAPDVIIMTSH